jgi:hypothetical protein
MIHNFHSQTAPVQFVTPVLQKRQVDIAALNGSASTVEIMSNLPSSAAGPSQLRPEPAESPITASRLARPAAKDATPDQKAPQPGLSMTSQSHQFQAVPARRSILNSTSPSAVNMSLIGDILGPTPQRAVIAAPTGTSPGRFSS